MLQKPRTRGDKKLGPPMGNRNACKTKPWAAAIERALEKRSKQALDELAEKFLNSCDEGQIPAFRELGDRLDGKPAQQLQVTGADDGPLVIEVVKFGQ